MTRYKSLHKKWLGIFLAAVMTLGSGPASVGAVEYSENAAAAEQSMKQAEDPQESRDTSGDETEAPADAQKDEEDDSSQDSASEKEQAGADPEASEEQSDTDHAASDEEADDSAEADIYSLLEGLSGEEYTGNGYAETDLKFVPGTYQVTAGLYIPGVMDPYVSGVPVYMTGQDESMTENIADNSQLEVKDDGSSMTLTVPVTNTIFGLQGIKSGSSATVAGLQKDGQITQVTFELGDYSGFYTLGKANGICSAAGEQASWMAMLVLGVDLSAVPQTQATPTPEPPESKLEAGTYTVTANLSMPGEYNPVISGVTVYANNPNNPFGPTLDENKASEVSGEIPNIPLSDNATLVVTKKGAKYLLLPVKNPIFTTQKLGTCSKLKEVSVERVKPTKGGKGDWDGSYNNRTDRIHKILVKLTDKETDGTVSYYFKNSVLYAVPLDMELAPTGDIALELSVDYSSVQKISDSTEVPSLKNSDNGNSGNNNNGNNSNNGDNKGNKNNGNNNNNNGGNSGNNNGNNSNGSTEQDSGSSTLKPGQYTVAANIWIDRSSAGLPLSPHLTNSAFPPKDPVSSNATLTVDNDSNASVYVPIVIPSRVMSVKSISGLNITSTDTNGDYLSGITVSLGKVTDPDAVITESCSVSLDLGELAQSITHKSREQVWAATFQVSISGVPASDSGGGNVDVNALIAQGTQESAKTTVRVGTLPGECGLSLAWMMQNADKEAEVQYSFTVEELDQKTAGSLTKKEKKKALYAQLRENFEAGKYDLILCTESIAQKLWMEEDNRDKYYILQLVTVSGAEDKDDTEKENIKLFYVLAEKAFADKNTEIISGWMKELKSTAAEMTKSPDRAAAYAKKAGLYKKKASARRLLEKYNIEILEGEEMQPEIENELGKKYWPKNSFYYKGGEKSSSDAKSQSVSETQSDEAQNHDPEASEDVKDTDTKSKTEIKDAESLSNAIEAALAKKSASAGDDSGSSEAESGDSNSAVEVSNSSGIDMDKEKQAAAKLEPGTYTVSANMYLPGELNTQLPGTTAYMTNPDNPLGVGGHEGIPMTPVKDNATLVVSDDGTKTVVIDLVNPVFTLQEIAAPKNSQILAGVRDTERYEGTNGVGVDGRITQLYIQLKDDSGIYPYGECHEFPTLLEADWYVELEMSVEFTTAEKISDETEPEIPEDTAKAATKEQENQSEND